MTSPPALVALATGGLYALVMNDLMAVGAGGAVALAHGLALVTSSRYRRGVAMSAELLMKASASASEIERLVDELSPSQKEHHAELRALLKRTVESYERLPGGRVMVASSGPRLEALLDSFVRLVTTLNTYRKHLGGLDKDAVAAELAELERDVGQESNERLKELKAQRVDILKKRLERFQRAEESREVVSHQLAGIEDLMRLLHEQSIAIRDPELAARQLEAVTAELQSTEETVRELEAFVELDEELRRTAAMTRVRT